MNSYIGENGTFKGMRKLNLEKIYKLILLNQPISRAHLSALTGLNKMTVSSCVDFLLNADVISEKKESIAKKGRPATLITINGEAGVIIGIEKNIPLTRIIVTSLTGELMENIILPDSGSGPLSYVEQISENITKLKKKYSHYKLGVIGIGIAFPGQYNPNTGVIQDVPNMPEWKQFPIKEKLENCQLGFPIFIHRNVEAGAMAEIHFGSSSTDENLVYISGTWGIGASFFSNGRIIPGSQGFAGRIGHMIIEINGRQCSCGNKGCLEEYASVRAMFNKLYPDKPQQQEYIDDMLRRVELKDPDVLKILKEISNYLTIGIVNVINAFNPETVCIGGYFGEMLKDTYIDDICSKVYNMLPDHYLKTLKVYCSGLKELGVAYGSIAIVREQLIDILIDYYGF